LELSSGGNITVLRTALFDTWVSAFVAEHPDGTLVEVGSGRNQNTASDLW
jgi:O-methyltransferase involved in polyketide biosynthesis